MKYFNIGKHLLALACVSAVFTACDKVDEVEEVGPGDGRTIVKLVDGAPAPDQAYKLLAIDFVPTPQTIDIIDVRRDAPTADELNKALTVTVKDDTAALRIYNDTVVSQQLDRPVLVPLPESWYTIGAATPKTGGSGGTYTLTLGAGEFAEQVELTIPDATLLDPSSTYGLAFTITTVSPDTYISQNRTIIIAIGAKNKYDGRYTLRSRHNRSPYTFPIETEMHMVTTGASTVRFFWPDAGDFGHPIGVGPDNSLSWYGTGIGPAVTFNPATNLVTDVFNLGSATPIRLAVPPAAPVSRYDEATRTMYVYWYYFTNTGQDFTNRGWSDTLNYIGPR